jgi:hypothetical protein
MLRAAIVPALNPPWNGMEPVRLGRVPAGPATADRFVTVESEVEPLLRVDLYRSSDEAFAFEDARVWSQFVVIGWGEHLYLVNLRTRQVSTVSLGSYFGHMYEARNDLLIATADCLFLLAPDGAVLWQSKCLGIDGVVVDRVDGETVQGQGEWDPPGGWRPFSINLRNGQAV